ncbi:DUF3551 domain-containing protein [Tardiphaga sp. vice352]|uniref:DUF3551 domain-containing protein n=1 Tax=unclassified Tardiphaga TaxID=2631404 RepID=UPI0011632F74|nr:MULTISPECIES: DUF3551 domain-containing protein [unclassified Tardiphaga]MBC7582282.1 DUF3551 domain-containing protein [Tardiphaga sp.]QDM16916.1 DUF3551 domain-containing protein [Tardiphaga sp. vice278]QDM21898.1 DUF3551 domain-containing protein [Tardiphaga sp. vice154]QDM27152.1 DUF3551 domain-containing protein [Tardiphaga sp. vice304]QDM32277.1 DUF3551 domain-containing protein [Tardiphaga sp. vice352]
MRKALFALMAIGTMTAIDIAPAAAAGGSYPICMRTRYDQDDCRFVTFEQCMASASGLGQSCFQNPALAYSQERYIDEPAPRRRPRNRDRYAY